MTSRSFAPSALTRPAKYEAPGGLNRSRSAVTKSNPRNLYDLPRTQLGEALNGIVTPAFRIKQVEEWMYLHGVDSFGAMTNLSKETRAALAARFTLAFPK